MRLAAPKKSWSDLVDTVTVGDCLEILAQIPDESVDVCFADPPFNLGKKYTNCNDQLAERDYLAWCRLWLRELGRIIKPSGSILVHNIPKWLIKFSRMLEEYAYFRHWIAWDAMSTPLGKTLLPAHYGLLHYTKHPTDFKFYEIRAPHKRCRVCNDFLKDWGGKKAQRHSFGYLVSDVWTDLHRIRHNSRRDPHPCQLPISLLERVVLMSTDVDDVIVDPFLGTGTTALAAKALGRHFIGSDHDPVYAGIAVKKIAEVQPSLFNGCAVSYYLGRLQSVRDADCELLFSVLENKRLRVAMLPS